MKITAKIITVVLPGLLIISCASAGKSGGSIEDLLKETAEKINDNRKYLLQAERPSGPGTGYFYILDKSGKITYHPVAQLIGKDFSGFSFIKRIIADKKGCISSNINGRGLIVYFDELNDREILCFAVEKSEMEQDVSQCIDVLPGEIR